MIPRRKIARKKAPGTSRARWGSLPNSYSDFISSIIGEEYGFFGLFLLVLAFFILISTTFLIAIREKNEIKKLISVGFGSWIFFQTVINLGGAVGIVPITGIVLPFFSYGSSAMISIFIALGMSTLKNVLPEIVLFYIFIQ